MDLLQNLCLQEIIDNFQMYYLAYSRTEDVSLKLKFEFLRRAYSFKMVTQMYDEFHLKSEYIDFLINKFLKVLDTQWLENCSWDVVTKKLAEIGPSLEKVSFQEDEKPWDKIMCHLPNLKTLFYHYYCNDEILHSIAEFCPKIESIDVQHSTKVSSDGIKYLCGNETGKSPCPVLKELLINSTDVGDDGVKYLIQNLLSLQKIDYYKLPEILYSIHKNDINALDKVKPYNLTHLNLSFMSNSPLLTDTLKICVFACPHLKSLNCPVLTQEHLDLCFQLSELTELHLDSSHESSLSINDFIKLKGKQLLSLDLNRFSMSVSILTQSCPLLTSLRMDKVNFECNDNESISVLNNLENISFVNLIMEDSFTTRAMIHLLSSSPNLEHLSFPNCKVFSSDLKAQILKCCKQCKLNDIDFSYSDVDLDFMKNVLLTCSSLQSLSIDGCEVVHSYSEINKLEEFALTLPNSPYIISNDHNFPDLNDSDESYNYFNDEDYDDSEDYDDYDNDDEDTEEYF